MNNIIGSSEALKKVMEDVRAAAPTTATILLTGESGTGKELIARAIHNHSPREKFIAVNCSAIPETLLESELFGYEKGAFTGAGHRRYGRFELADSGTIFLDEIGELPPAIQVKLLRVLEEKCFERLGGEKEIKVDVRVITATNRDLGADVAAGRFREDLFYRINVINIHIPPLRERRGDIELLIDYFIDKFAIQSSRLGMSISARAKTMLSNLMWPGNIRELSNTIERAITLSRNHELDLSDFVKPEQTIVTEGSMLLSDVEAAHVKKVLTMTDFNIVSTAKLLGIARGTLYNIIKTHKIVKPRRVCA